MAESQSLLVRLLNTPDLEKVVPRLQPEILHRVIQTCGLEDCADVVALATPEQLARVLDLDIWRAPVPGVDEEFDAERFGAWVEVLMQSGAAVAAEKLLGLDVELVIAGLARHAAVFDSAAILSYTNLAGEHVQGRAANSRPVFDIGGYTIEAKRTTAWEPLLDLLVFLEAEYVEYFHRVMRGCVRLSNGPREDDGFHALLEDDEQHMFDLACDRERRRERQGYVTPAQARAFLLGGRALRLDGDRPPRSVIATAYFRAIEGTPGTDDADAGLVEVLREAGVITPPRALLVADHRHISALSFIREHVASHPASAEALAYLANAVMAGCSIQGRPFTAREASDCVVATCNLGLENWPSHWSDRDLVTAFQVGWAILDRDVCLYAVQHSIEVLAGFRCADRDIMLRLHGLRRALIQHVETREPRRVRQAMDAIVMLDARAWAVLCALIDECPVIAAALSAGPRCRTINRAEFAFVAENRQIAAVREFMASLPSLLAQ